MPFTTEGYITVSYPINESLAIDDYLYCTCTDVVLPELLNKNIGPPILWGIVTEINSNTNQIGFNLSELGSSGFPTVSCAGTWFLSFTKNPTVNKSSLKGYYNLVKFINDDNNNEIELFMVNSEVTRSSK